MKTTAVLLIVMLFSATIVFGQEVSTDTTINLKDLETPNSPAFMLLDQAPTTIEHPTSSKAFVASVLNSFNTGNGLPQNYAVDFTPFWFVKHPKMTALSYMGYDADKHRQKIFNDFQKFSVSFAYLTNTDTLTKKPVNNVSLGIRFNLIKVRNKKDISDLLTANEQTVKLLKNVDHALQAYIGDPNLVFTNPALYHAKVKQFYAKIDSISKIYKDEFDFQKDNVLKPILNRKALFSVDGALGYDNFFLDNSFANSHFGRFGAWTTLNLAFDIDTADRGNNYFNLYALGRFISDGTNLVANKYTRQNNLDIGGKLEFQFKTISIGYEYVYRSNNINNTFRSNGQIKYKISDQLVLTGAFGRNFGTGNNLISMLGINWGISSPMQQAVVK